MQAGLISFSDRLVGDFGPKWDERTIQVVIKLSLVSIALVVETVNYLLRKQKHHIAWGHHAS